MREKIISIHNPQIKNLIRLQKTGERKKQNTFVIEGFKEFTIAYKSGYLINKIYCCKELLTNEHNIFLENLNTQLTEVSSLVFDKIAYRENRDGIIALAVPKYIELKDLSLSESPLIIVLEAVEKPGNLGAVLRTADAANADAVIICDHKTDIYNPNVIRSSLGCVFTDNIVACTSEDAIDWLRMNKISILASMPSAGISCYDTDMKHAIAIVLGTEAQGLTDKWMNSADKKITIPMFGTIDSLNVSNAAAILVYEARRQKGMVRN